jgi:hypothetical protein
MDVTDIEAGVDFIDVIQRAVGSCDVLLAVVGREWLTCSALNGRRRLDDPRDFIRLEIGTALTRNVRVIPVLVEGAVMPGASELPAELEPLTRRQAVELRDARWDADVESLARVLYRVLGPGQAAKKSVLHQPRRTKLWALAAVVLVAAVLSVVALITRGGSTPSGPPASVSSEPIPSTTTAPPQTAPGPVSPGRGVRPASALAETRPVGTPRNGGWLGVQLVGAADDSSGAGTRGAMVHSVAAGGPAALAGVLVGDLVVEYSGTPVSDVAALIRLAGVNPPVDSVLIRVRRGNTGRTLEVGRAHASVPVTSGNVLIYYAADEDRKTAEELAAELRKIRAYDPRYVVRTLKTTRGIDNEGQVRYSSSGLSPLAGTLARRAGTWLSESYGRRVAFTPMVDPRVTATSMIVIMPGRAPAPVLPR